MKLVSRRTSANDPGLADLVKEGVYKDAQVDAFYTTACKLLEDFKAKAPKVALATVERAFMSEQFLGHAQHWKKTRAPVVALDIAALSDARRRVEAAGDLVESSKIIALPLAMAILAESGNLSHLEHQLEEFATEPKRVLDKIAKKFPRFLPRTALLLRLRNAPSHNGVVVDEDLKTVTLIDKLGNRETLSFKKLRDTGSHLALGLGMVTDVVSTFLVDMVASFAPELSQKLAKTPGETMRRFNLLRGAAPTDEERAGLKRLSEMPFGRKQPATRQPPDKNAQSPPRS